MTGAREGEAVKAQAVPAARRWSFATAVLDERSLELLVENQPAELEPKPLEVLLHLLRHAGEVVTKDELLEAVWPGRVLSDSAITSCVKKLREALRDDEQNLIKTVHGYGYRLVAPVKVEASEAAAPPPRFDFSPGDSPPLRPMWKLVQRLGTGGHGEAWLARHEKTRDPRVFKFAAGGAALASLKREITLYRLLHDALGDAVPAIEVLDWNLTDPPCFLELPYAQQGSLVEWAAAQGGPEKIPFAVRIELLSQVAEALAAAHSIGVLHKDLKPSNVLVVSAADGTPRIKLSDFGSGGLLDPARLEAMGITRLGFTQTLAAQVSGGTPMYCAPEVIAGQPPTIQADIYSLGVMLYQLIVGDLKRALSAGWERDVEDELLREDIAQAAEGHASHRLADAAVLAQRLRTLTERREQRKAQIVAQEEAARAKAATERAQQALERMRARRNWMRATMAALTIGSVATLMLFLDARQARDAAAESAATSKAVSAFLSQDMFAQIGSDQRPLKNLTLKEVLDGAAAQVDKRFADQPQTAAEVHLALGASYEALDDVRGMARELHAALALLAEREEPVSQIALDTASTLVTLKYIEGQLNQSIGPYARTRDRGREALGELHPSVLRLSQQLAFGHYLLGNWVTAADEFRRLLGRAAAAAPSDEAFVGTTERMLGHTLLQLGEFTEAEKILRQAVERLIRAAGDENVRVAQARTFLAEVLAETGRYDEADGEIGKAVDAAANWAPSLAAGYVARARVAQGRLRMEQGRYAEAQQILEDSLRVYVAQKKPEERDQSVTQRRPLAETYQRAGRLADAEDQAQLALASAEEIGGLHHPLTEQVRIGLADILRERGKVAEARQQLERVNRQTLARLPAQHPIVGLLRRAEGLALLSAADYAAARGALAEALQICEYRYGAVHWRTQRARKELAAVPPAGS